MVRPVVEWGKEKMVRALPAIMTVWIVDSNAFIHLGSIASEDAIKSMGSALAPHGGVMHVTSGVHDEVKTVRFRSWKGRPRVLDVLKDLLQTTSISPDEVRGLAAAIGEKAAPQDVDVSLMVLAARMHGEGRDVVLVSDDYKMTTTRERAGLGYSTCPPSTFLQRLADGARGSDGGKLRSLARRVRAAEMRYAISRAGEYDIQGKLTWLVESLLTARPPIPPPVKEDGGGIEISIRALRRHIAGEKVKASALKRLGDLPSICASVGEIDGHLESLLGEGGDPSDLYVSSLGVLQSVLESTGMGLAPLNDELCMIAHRVMAGPISRLESVLGLLAGSLGRNEASSLHLARALSQASLAVDASAESRIMHHLGLMAIAADEPERAASLFDGASAQSLRSGNSNLRHLIAAGISRHLSGDGDGADSNISEAARIIDEDEGSAIEPLVILARSLMGIDRPWLALEIFDEALECAIEAEIESEVDRIRNLLTLVNVAAVGEEDDERRSLRRLLDGLNRVEGIAEERVETVTEEVDEAVDAQLVPIEETWREWRASNDLVPDGEALSVVRVVEGEGGLLAVVHHSELGGLGIWLPGEAPELAPGQRLTISGTRIKLAEPTKDLTSSQNIRGVIAVESPEALKVSIEAIQDSAPES
tara:strand:- start:14082 stop:16028 length:1947 start_codon:yes stop_codon:yes gene_type:complete